MSTGSPRSVGGQRARELCQAMPRAGSKTIAARLLNEHPGLYKDIEHARHMVRYYRGESGVKHRQDTGHAGSGIATTKYEAPPTDAKPWKPYQWTHQGRGLIMADMHMPYHDPAGIELAVNYAIEHKATDFCLLLGDVVDAYQLSKYCRDPEARNWAGEIEMADEFLRGLAQRFDKLIFKAGNHERRLVDYMRVRAPALIGVAEFELPAVLHLADYEADYVDWGLPIYVGEHLTILHGHEFGGSMWNPVNAARGLFLRAKACAICAHSHATSQHDEPTVRGEPIATWSIGCLCDMHPEYATLNKWNQGFGILEVSADDWNLNNLRIVKGKVRT